ncbi:tail fiber protein [Flammeovirga kamogawensis]|uniref:Phage tail protein n=1 Tax=Flammeovirga kamogawensis TaxID=373891 RepID=A0ABX8GS14_9BACT|nr:tail fiber protein [Flammeovirga kamogawensis]MBB6463686.1 microcystin-dependent protein [Flammeovirga kamogawensis]QWG06186.1 phage tail protein [Flammeovirga kamogawensis]TRX68017.1 tail fiber protein [Flammeovirga kamogawensis]
MLLKTHYRSIILIALLFLNSNLFAQSGGFVVQGLARNSLHAAIPNKVIDFKFTIVSNDKSSTYFSETKQLVTNAQGVFSHEIGTGTVSTGSIQTVPYKDANLKLIISMITNSTENVISEQIINYVPYAFSALNGAPSGSIVPFTGTDVPLGWMLCDGSSVPSGTYLKDMIGMANAPDLRGMYLRGTGTNGTHQNSNNDYATGPGLNSYEKDQLGDHGHDNDFSVDISNDGSHTHSYSKFREGGSGNLGRHGGGVVKRQNISRTTGNSGDHTHSTTIGGSVGAATGDGVYSETQPVSYGVNYIIKL